MLRLFARKLPRPLNLRTGLDAEKITKTMTEDLIKQIEHEATSNKDVIDAKTVNEINKVMDSGGPVNFSNINIKFSKDLEHKLLKAVEKAASATHPNITDTRSKTITEIKPSATSTEKSLPADILSRLSKIKKD
jgi:hypothetical protein